MPEPASPYAHARIHPTVEQLKGWSLVWGDKIATGPCPRCHDTMNTSWQTTLVEMSAENVPQSVTRRVECGCGRAHVDGEQTKSSCGAFWFATFHSPPTDPAVTPQGDAKVVTAAEAFQNAADGEETRLRGAAEKWVAGVASVLALFGIAGTVTGGTTIRDLPDGEKNVVLGLALLAILAAVIAIASSYLAAYGWPKKTTVKTDEQLLNWYDNRQDRISTAAARLRDGVIAAIVSIVLLAACASVASLTPAKAVEPTFMVTLGDDSTRCGLLLAPKQDGQLRLRVVDGTVSTISVVGIVKLEAVEKC
ncbi:hypothetical protein [Kribbella monticola]|uniref:hypothetical protein n=1 Tax=Kribbella monticola TaxID=2185285 RepID=UPI001300AA93|nr:hypothetical protein [Kribbella monticola]